MPVDPVRAIVGEEADPATYQQVYEELGMDRPVYVQFARYLGDTLRGDFGPRSGPGSRWPRTSRR